MLILDTIYETSSISLYVDMTTPLEGTDCKCLIIDGTNH